MGRLIDDFARLRNNMLRIRLEVDHIGKDLGAEEFKNKAFADMKTHVRDLNFHICVMMTHLSQMDTYRYTANM